MRKVILGTACLILAVGIMTFYVRSDTSSESKWPSPPPVAGEPTPNFTGFNTLYCQLPPEDLYSGDPLPGATPVCIADGERVR